MSFQNSDNVRVDEGHILRARLQNNNGDWVDAELNLDDVIGNENGFFQWGGNNFSSSAKDISFNVEGDANSPILRGTLTPVEGDETPRDVNLAERIRNEDGQFKFE